MRINRKQMLALSLIYFLNLNVNGLKNSSTVKLNALSTDVDIVDAVDGGITAKNGGAVTAVTDGTTTASQAATAPAGTPVASLMCAQGTGQDCVDALECAGGKGAECLNADGEVAQGALIPPLPAVGPPAAGAAAAPEEVVAPSGAAGTPGAATGGQTAPLS